LTDEQQLSVRQLAEEQGRLAALIGELGGQRDETDGGPERKPDE
jgi:hypothetical protein